MALPLALHDPTAFQRSISFSKANKFLHFGSDEAEVPHVGEGTSPKGVAMRTIKILAVAVATLALLWLAGPAMAQEDPYPPGGGVEGANEGRDGNVSGSTDDADDAEGGLPFTGAEITLYSAVGLGAIGAGVLILRRTRTRTDA